jgi:hypothetical protein
MSEALVEAMEGLGTSYKFTDEPLRAGSEGNLKETVEGVGQVGATVRRGEENNRRYSFDDGPVSRVLSSQ